MTKGFCNFLRILSNNSFRTIFFVLYFTMEARYMTDLEWRICHSVNIYLYRNGKDGETPVLVHIPPSKKKNMKSILNAIQERVKYPVGYATQLFKMDGKKVRHPCELEMYNNYVVASNYDKHFKCAQYGRKKSPLLVLNRDSKHVRVLRQQNQNYHEWILKKQAVGEERPQYIYPTFYTSENARAQDLPVGQVGNFVPPGALGSCCPNRPGNIGENQKGYPTNQPNQVVNTCIISNSKKANEVFKAHEENLKISHDKTDDGIHQLWKQENNKKLAINESDIVNANILTDGENPNDTAVEEDILSDNNVNKNSYPINNDIKTKSEDLGLKYKRLVREIKRSLRSGTGIDTDSSDSSIFQSLQNISLNKNALHRKSHNIYNNKKENEFLVLPPPPTQFRDDKGCLLNSRNNNTGTNSSTIKNSTFNSSMLMSNNNYPLAVKNVSNAATQINCTTSGGLQNFPRSSNRCLHRTQYQKNINRRPEPRRPSNLYHFVSERQHINSEPQIEELSTIPPPSAFRDIFYHRMRHRHHYTLSGRGYNNNARTLNRNNYYC